MHRRPHAETAAQTVKGPIAFALACAYELLVLGLAFVWGFFFEHSVISQLRFTWADTTLALLATLPPLWLFIWTLNSKHALMSRHRKIVDSVVKPIFEQWSILQLGAISVLAGVCEEAFFRGALQASLSHHLGALWGLVIASLVFGIAHLLTWTYAFLATLIGAYLGLLFALTDNLLVPVLAHAAYDFVALVWLLRRRTAASEAGSS